MARRKTTPELVRTKCSLSERLREVRAELFGERGGPELARRLGIPVRTWYNYEAGVTVPAEVVLRIIQMTSLEPTWLLNGNGPKYRTQPPEGTPTAPAADLSVRVLLRTALQRLEQDAASSRAADPYPVLLSRAPESQADRVPGDLATNGHAAVTAGPDADLERREWREARRESRFLRVVGDAMTPLLADGAYVTFAKEEEPPAQLDGKLVVYLGEDPPIVRWFQDCGRYALLRAEDSSCAPILVDLGERSESQRFLRVLWINTPH